MKTLPGITLALTFAQFAAFGLLTLTRTRRNFAPEANNAAPRPSLSRRMKRIMSGEKKISEIDFG